MGIKCCLNCKERHEACWSSCEKYLAEKKKAKQISEDRVASANARIIYSKTRRKKTYKY